MPSTSVMPLGDPQVDPSRFGDPVALKADWSPLGTGTDAGTGALSYYEFGGSAASGFQFQRRSASWVPYIIVMAMIVAALKYLPEEFGLDRTALTVVVLVPAVPIALIVLFMRWRRSRAKPPMVFDRESRTLRKDGETIRYADVHALQILTEVTRYTGKRSRTRVHHEVNLVLHTGARVSVTRYLRREEAQAIAREMGLAFGIPVWDASHEHSMLAGLLGGGS